MFFSILSHFDQFSEFWKSIGTKNLGTFPACSAKTFGSNGFPKILNLEILELRNTCDCIVLTFLTKTYFRANLDRAHVRDRVCVWVCVRAIEREAVCARGDMMLCDGVIVRVCVMITHTHTHTHTHTLCRHREG